MTQEKGSIWAQQVRAGRQKGLKIVWIGFLSLIGLGMVFFFILDPFKSGAKTKNPPSNASAEMNHLSEVFQENEKHIAELQSMTKALMNPVNSESSKDEIKRSQAKTEVYQASIPPSGGSTQASSKNDLGNVQGWMSLSGHPSSSAKMLKHPERTIAQGELIQATLETAISSEFPGMIRAVISAPVYAYEGGRILIPEGSRVIGQYLSLQGNGSASDRLFVIWNRILTPTGRSITLESPGTDSLGGFGVKADAVNRHFMERFGQSVLLSIIGGGVAMVGNASEASSPSASVRESLMNNFQSIASQSMERNSIRPSLFVHQGDAIQIFVAKDLEC